MKHFFLLFIFFPLTALFAQKVEFFPNIVFDSSYSVVGTFDYPNDQNDTTSRVGFLINKLDDLLKLKKEWIFSEKVPRINFDGNSITIYTIQDKRTVQKVGLIYPKQGIINCNGKWFYFDVKKYSEFFDNHSINYHSRLMKFEKYSQYAAYGNTLLSDSTVLLFLEPSLRFEGKFTLTADRTPDPADPYFVLRDINQELGSMFSKDAFQCSIVENDSFNQARKDKVKITVECSRNLYDRYKNKKYDKGEWTPSPIDIRVFWQD